MTPDVSPGPVESFLGGARGFVDLVERLDGADLAGPGLGDWDLRSLVGHTSRSVLTVLQYLHQPAPTVELARAADYFVRIRELAAVLDPADVAARGRVAGEALGDDPAGAVRRMVAEVTADLAAVEGDPVITTIAGGMHLSCYLPTRTFELVVHGLDVAEAIQLRWTPDDDALAAALTVATETSIALGSGPPLLRALTGRGGEITSIV
ncbi:MAG: hypothetical protein JWO11_2221 [Nocardioides sp.]|nr:hypothetical protein [Nocardioides sp.]